MFGIYFGNDCWMLDFDFGGVKDFYLGDVFLWKY